MVQIRTAGASDLESIRQLHLDAFDEEGESVSELALSLIQDESAQPALALVAEADGGIVGNVVFSPIRISDDEQVAAYILVPLAVARGFQHSGVGRQLVESGLDALRKQGVEVVFVLGDPAYYGRFGFSARHRVRPPYELAYPEAWMALSLSGIALESMNGQLTCASSLMDPKYW